MRTIRATALVAMGSLAMACASLGSFASLVQPPRFSEARDQPAEVRINPPSVNAILGSASTRLWTRVANPNPFGFTISSISGTLFLDDTRAATSEFPLGLPIAAGGDAVVPIDFVIDFGDLPGLANVIRRAVSRQPVAYRFDGTVGINAGALGTPSFGPLTLIHGTFE